MSIVVITQARMTSTRLPGKIMKEVLGKPLLDYQVERLRRCRLVDRVVVATTTNETDQVTADFCLEQGIDCFRGSEDDVLSRFYHAALDHGADLVVRVTSDCPLIDPVIVDQTIQFYLDHHPTFDYVSNTLDRRYPRGMDTEVFSFEALSQAHHEATIDYEREHVTPFFYRRPERYQLGSLRHVADESRHRWTVDTPEDFELIQRILEALYPNNPTFTMQDVLDVMERHPDWVLINAHVEQKKLGE